MNRFRASITFMDGYTCIVPLSTEEIRALNYAPQRPEWGDCEIQSIMLIGW